MRGNSIGREEAERRIAEMIDRIAGVMRDYGAPSGYLSMTIMDNGGYISFSNESWEGGRDRDVPLDFHRYGEAESWG